ncbi:OmpA family protein [Niveibacterium umoris]
MLPAYSMRLSFRLLGIGFVLFGLGATPAIGASGPDHPEVPPYPGAKMDHYDFKEYEEFQLILSKPYLRGSEYVADKLMPLEGAVTYIHYNRPESASALQIFRNYQSALRRSGFTELFTCERPCTESNLGDFQKLMKARDLYLNYSRDNQYLAAQRGNTYVSMWVNDGGIWQFVVEKGQLDDGRIAVSGNSPIAKSLSENGKVDLYGFQFDTGKATLTAASAATLKELGKVLQDNPTLKLDIIGHTDDVGGADANQQLSEARASAVAMALATQQGIDMGRLNASGRGMTQPVAPNTTDAGRAKNRRVEIVARSATAASPGGTTTASAPRATPAARQTQQQAPAQGNSQEASKGITINDAVNAIDAAAKLKGLFGL